MSFGDATSFGDCDELLTTTSLEPLPMDRRRGFGDSDGFGDAGGFDWTGPRRRKTDPRG